MATYKRVMVEIDSVKFFPLEAHYQNSRNANQVGRRIGESLQGSATILVDAHDTSNISQDNLTELHKYSIESKDPLHKVSITWYREDGDNVLANAEFMGWVSAFEFVNPSAASGNTSGINNLLRIGLTVVLDEANVSKHKFTK
jgi:hypothetical protein